MNRFFLLLLSLGLLTWVIGCSGGATNAPVFPDGDNPPGPVMEPSIADPVEQKPVEGPRIVAGENAAARVPLAFYTITVDPDSGKLDIELLRTADMHLNAVPLLEGGAEKLLTLTGPPVISNGGKQLDVDVRITHPDPDPLYTAFDIHGTLITKGSVTGWDDFTLVTAGPDETRLLNADGYTRWWNPKEFFHPGMYGYTPGKLGAYIPAAEAAVINGYKVFADGLGPTSALSDMDPANRAMFSVGSSCIRHYTIWLGGGLVFNYAVDASWAFPTKLPPVPPDDFPKNANMAEPYWIEVEEWVNTLWYEKWEGYGGNVFYHVTIHDWQGPDTIGVARIEIPQLSIEENLWDLIEEGPDYKKYDFRVIMPLLESNDDLDVLFTVDSATGNYQPGLTGVDKPLRSYYLQRTIVSDEDPVYNKTPVCIMFATTPTDILKGQSVSFNASESYDPDGQVIDYSWDFNGDDYFGDPWTGGTAAKPVKTYSEYGNYYVRCQIEDNKHAKVISDPILVNVTSVDNLMPFAIAEATTPTEIMSDETVTFDASESYDIDGEISSYLWDFDGDEIYGDEYDSGTDVNPTVSWPAGEYDVDLKVIDNEAGYDCLDKKIHVSVGNYPPIAAAVATTSTGIYSGETVSFDASTSHDADGTIEQYNWDFDGDEVYGDAYESGDDIAPTKLYPEPGEYDVDLQVVDNLNAKDKLDVKIHITVTNPPPVADAVAVTPTDIYKNESVEFDATGSYDINGTIDLYEWDFNGDTVYGDTNYTGDVKNPTVVYDKAGTFDVGLRVVDNNGAEDFLDVPITVNVTNRLPTADAGFILDPPYYMNILYDISGSASSDPDGTIDEYAWDVNYDGMTFNPTLYGEEIQAYWPTEGEYAIMLRITDDDGGIDFLDASIHIEIFWCDNSPPIIDSIEMSRTTTLWGCAEEAVTLTCTAHDPNVGDTLTYEWSCPVGSFNVDDEAIVVWTAPAGQTGKYHATCRVYDNYNDWDEEQSDLIRVTRYPTADMLPDTAPPAYNWTMITLWDIPDTYTLSDYSPGGVVYMNFWFVEG